jgi:hypothetical protein
MRAATTLLLFAALAAAEPVGRIGWERDRDPLRRRLASLCTGEPIRAGAVTVVPLFARVPSEAGHGREVDLELASAETRASSQDVPAGYLRVATELDVPVLVVAGTVYSDGRRARAIARDAVIPARFTALLPVAEIAGGSGTGRAFVPLASLPPRSTARLLHGGTEPEPVFRVLRGANGTYREVLFRADVASRRRALHAKTRFLDEARARTAVGAMFLVGNRAVAAHVFDTHRLFLDALPGLLWSVAVQARAAELQDAAEAHRLAALADGEGRALAMLRSLRQARVDATESYGTGFDLAIVDEQGAAVGQAVLSHGRRVVHIACFDLAGLPGTPTAAQPGDDPARPPDAGGSETAPGVVDRRPRPSVADARERARKPR